MTKTEIVKQGYWPEWFLEGLVSDIPDLSISSKEKLKWLLEILNISNSDLSEVDLAESLGIYPVYNSGNFKYELKI